MTDMTLTTLVAGVAPRTGKSVKVVLMF